MSWFERDGIRVWYVDEGAGEPVLMLPGFAGSIEELAFLRNVLVDAGLRVIAADLPGSGQSQPQPRTYTATYLQDDARLFLSLLTELQAGPAHLVGFSDGGEVALLMAVLAPDAVSSLVTWGAAGRINDPEGHLRQAMDTVIESPIPPMQEFSEYLVATYGRENALATTRSFAAALDEIVAAGGDISFSRAGGISCPALLIAGEHDPFAPAALLRELGDRIVGSEVVIVPGAGHAIHAEQPDWLRQTLQAWFARRPAISTRGSLSALTGC
jgi:pimeloyl-ACP methyl ester carboxylesterase